MLRYESFFFQELVEVDVAVATSRRHAALSLPSPGQDSVDAGRSLPFWATIVWDGQAFVSNLQEGPQCSLQSSVVVLAWICSVEMAKERQTATPDSVWQ